LSSSRPRSTALWRRAEPQRPSSPRTTRRPAVDDYTLCYDLDDPPARQLADRCPSLPDAVQRDSAEGEQLLVAARDRTRWHGQEAVEYQQQAPAQLYDQRGNGIRDEARLREIVTETDDELWLVPAIALKNPTTRPGTPTR